jgi:hypothetical protein
MRTDSTKISEIKATGQTMKIEPFDNTGLSSYDTAYTHS